MKRAHQYIVGLMYTDGKPSPQRFYPAVAFLFWLLLSGHLAVTGKTWGHYDTFAGIAGFGALAYLLGNRLVDAKYNSEKGKMPEKE